VLPRDGCAYTAGAARWMPMACRGKSAFANMTYADQ
jgi:hypothetical protein